jgi:hypothetical protein
MVASLAQVAAYKRKNIEKMKKAAGAGKKTNLALAAYFIFECLSTSHFTQ